MKKQYERNTQNTSHAIASLSNCCWLLSLAALWPSCIISAEEQSGAIALLKRRLAAAGDRYQTCREISQRVLLTRQRMIENAGYGISNLPTRFFNSTEKGFAASESWYRELQAQRKLSRVFRLKWRTLSEAILEFTEDSTEENFNYWKHRLIDNNAQDCWMLYSLFTCYYLISRL